MAELAMREAYGRALADYGAINPEVVALDADTSSSTLSCYFAQRFPERFFNLGIAEPCMVDVAVGLALNGHIPFVNAFAALLALRAVEAIRTCVAYAGTNVKLAAGYAGVSDFKDGPTHHAITDIAFLRALPGMTVVVPADATEAAAWVPVVAEHPGPVYLRLSRAATLPVHSQPPDLAVGRGLVLREGSDATLIACGAMVGRSLQAAGRLADEGIAVRLIDMPTIKPLDVALVRQAATETGALITAEEHSLIGGLYGAVAECLAGSQPVPIEAVGIADTFARTALDSESLMDACGLGVADIVGAVKRAVLRKQT